MNLHPSYRHPKSLGPTCQFRGVLYGCHGRAIEDGPGDLRQSQRALVAPTTRLDPDVLGPLSAGRAASVVQQICCKFVIKHVRQGAIFTTTRKDCSTRFLLFWLAKLYKPCMLRRLTSCNRICSIKPLEVSMTDDERRSTVICRRADLRSGVAVTDK